MHNKLKNYKKMNKDYLEFINSVRKFNEFAKFEFLRRYYEYFNRNADPNHNTTYKIKINQFSDEAIKQFPSMTLQDQYDLIFELETRCFMLLIIAFMILVQEESRN